MEGTDSRLGNKRARDCSLALTERVLDQEPTSLKRLCAGFEIRDANISSILDTVAEVDEFYDQGELDEVQERLVFGVMKSLEEELGVSGTLSPHFSSENVNDNSSSLVDSEKISIIEDTHVFAETSQDDASSSSDDDISYVGEGSLPSIAAGNFSELKDLLEKSSQIVDRNFLQSVETLHAESLSFSANAKPQQRKTGVDIGYLLEASDDELGISPSPSSENSKSELDLVSYTFPETDYASIGSTSDSLDLKSCQYESDWLSGGHFDLDFESDPTTQEWIKNALSNLKAGLDPSIRAHSVLDAATAACLEPACASH